MRLIFTIAIGFLPLIGWAQDPTSSQPYAAPLHLNPAYAGSEGCSRISSSYRNQWPSKDGNFQTVFGSYDQYVHPFRGGIGVNFMYDNAGGVLNTWAGSVIYSPTFGLFKPKLLISPALELGVRDLALNMSNLDFGTTIDSRYGFVYPTQTENPMINKIVFDASVGLVLSHHGLSYGVALRHITQPDEGYSGVSKLPLKITAHAMYGLQLEPKVKLIPSFVYEKQAQFQYFLPTVTAVIIGCRIGIGFRASPKKFDSVIFSTGYSRKWFSVGYSYDYTVSTLGNNSTGGSHQLSLQFKFNCRNKAVGQKGASVWGM